MINDDFLQKVNALDSKLNAEVIEEGIKVVHPKYDFEHIFEYVIDGQDKLYQDIEQFINTEFYNNQAVYFENYFEILINVSNFFWVDALRMHYDFKMESSETYNDKIFYKVNDVSEVLSNYLNQNIDNFEASYLTSIKIYNINKVKKIPINDEKIIDIFIHIAKSIIFQISLKHSISLQLLNPEEDEDENYELFETAKGISKTIIEDRYDNDLLNYYYRALQMQESEFKYLAFYQVIECIFDEVYMHETIQDVKSIIESGSFSTMNNDNLKEVINVVNRYSKEQNDRNKTKLVLEKYFKGEVHQEAFLISNQPLISYLKELKKIKDDKELEDIQKIANILYDFRNECTHSNRAYPISREFLKSKEELQIYINMIKKVSEKIILNYKVHN